MIVTIPIVTTKSILFSALLFLLINLPIYATIRYVKAGNPTPVAPYTSWETASDSIQKVVDICESGDTILIGTGIYREEVISEHPGRDLAIIGIDVDSCVVDLSGFPQFTEIFAFMMDDNLSLENLTVKTIPYSTKHTALGVYGMNGFVKIGIRNNKFLGAFQHTVKFWWSTGEVTGNYIRGAYFGIETQFPPDQGPALTIRNNVVHDCQVAVNASTGQFTDNLLLNFSKSGIGVPIVGGSGSFSNNLIIAKKGSSSRGLEYARGTFKNNIIRNCTNAVHTWSGQPLNLVNNIIDSCGTIFDLYNSGVVIGNISYNNFYGSGRISSDVTKLDPDTLIYSTLDPMYESMDSTNYRLQMYSPLIDAGDPGILDIDGSRSDIGRYGGPYGESYPYKDLPPKKPRFTLVTKQNGKIMFNWQGGTEADFNLFSLHRDRNPQFIPDESNLIYSDRDTIYSDSLLDPTGNYTYKITAKDNQGLVSRWDSVTVVLTDIADGTELTPEAVVLYQNYPNPFNPSTTIRFRLDSPGEVILRVYDVNGAIVAILNNGWLPAGEHERDFTPGTIGSMDDIASGVYFYNLTVRDENLKPVFIKSDKMMFIK